MKYERPELFRIGSLEANTFGGNKQASQDGTDTYSKNHGESSVYSSYRKARATAARLHS